jgi:hypothetical protein
LIKLLILLFPALCFGAVDYRVDFYQSNLPMMVCPYFYQNQKWFFVSAWFFKIDDRLESLAVAFVDRFEGGHGLCATTVVDPQSRKSYAKLFNFYQDSPYEIVPRTCTPIGGGRVKVLQASKNRVEPGKSYSMETEVNDPGYSRLRLTMYFLTYQDTQSWPSDFWKSAHQKCLELAP